MKSFFLLGLFSICSAPVFAQSPLVGWNNAPSKRMSTKNFPLSGPSSFNIQNGNGPIVITESFGADVEIKVENETSKQVGWSVQTALEQISIIIPQRDDRRDLAKARFEPKISLLVKIPSHLLRDLQASASLGGVHVEGLFKNVFAKERKLLLSTELGNIECSKIEASKTEITTQEGSVKITSISGDELFVQTYRGKIELEGGVVMTRSITATSNTSGAISSLGSNAPTIALGRTKHGSIYASNNVGNISAMTGMGDVKIENQSGGTTLRAETSNGGIELVNNSVVDTVFAKNEWGGLTMIDNKATRFQVNATGEIAAEDNSGTIFAENKVGGILIRDQINGSVYARSNTGSIHLQNPRAVFEKGESSSGTVHLVAVSDHSENCENAGF